MAVKGKALVDAAKMKAEVAKLNKFEAAVSIFFASRGGLPDVADEWGVIHPRVFADAGLLTMSDMTNGIDSKDWFFVVCQPAPYDSNVFYHVDLENGRISGINVCVTGIDDNENLPYTGRNPDISARLACNIEVMKDDENATAGNGRGYGDGSAGSRYAFNAYSDAEIQANFKVCDNYPTGILTPYAFKVF
jgi:hypothetical protein